MSLKLTFNLVFASLFALALAVTSWGLHRLVNQQAEADVVRDAERLMDVALAVRDYTTTSIKPHLDPLLDQEFLPQTVPAFAATETLRRLADKSPGYSYKEAALNPTNLRDQPTPWERDIILAFRSNTELAASQGRVRTVDGERFYVARPIQIKSPGCLKCHSTPEAAPASMLKKYGPAYGFGWKLGEVIGAQIVAVPTALPAAKAQQVFYSVMGGLVAVFAALFLALNLLLHRLVVHPVRQVAEAASRLSQGDWGLGEFKVGSRNEIGQLQEAFNRLRRSLQRAMQMIKR